MSEHADAAAIAAAEWWARAVQAPTYDNGDRSGMTGMLMTLVAAHQPDAQPQQAASFAEVLAPRLQADLDRMASFDGDPYICVGVDYGPEKILADAARDAGISTSKFPWKTMMWIRPDHVTVSAGYGAATTLVWASGEWLSNRPVCTSQKWDESRTDYRTYHGEPWSCSLPIYHDGAHQFDRPLALCVTCGRPDSWYHRADERGHMPDFHEFAAPSAVAR